MKKSKPILNKNQISELGKYLQSEEWQQKLIAIQKETIPPHCHSYPSNKKCCIDWWNSVKDVPFNI